MRYRPVQLGAAAALLPPHFHEEISFAESQVGSLGAGPASQRWLEPGGQRLTSLACLSARRACASELNSRSVLAGHPPPTSLPLQKQNFFQQMMHSLNQRR